MLLSIHSLALHRSGEFVLLLLFFYSCLFGWLIFCHFLLSFVLAFSMYSTASGAVKKKRMMVLKSTFAMYCVVSLEECGIQRVGGDRRNSVEQTRKRRDNLMIIMPLSWRTRCRSSFPACESGGSLSGFCICISLGRLERSYVQLQLVLGRWGTRSSLDYFMLFSKCIAFCCALWKQYDGQWKTYAC